MKLNVIVQAREVEIVRGVDPKPPRECLGRGIINARTASLSIRSHEEMIGDNETGAAKTSRKIISAARQGIGGGN